MFRTIHVIIIGFCFIIGVSVAGFLLSKTMLNAQTGVNTASVKGLSERQVVADELRWDLIFSSSQVLNVVDNVAIGEFDRAAVLANAKANRDKLLAALKDAGFKDSEISFSQISFDTDSETNRYEVTTSRSIKMSGFVLVKSTNFSIVNTAQNNILEAIVDGAGISGDPPRYIFSSLNTIKPDMLREATQNARIAADEFAKNAGVKVGGIQNAAQGAFSVSDLNGNYSEENEIEKIVRVVVNATFYLEN